MTGIRITFPMTQNQILVFVSYMLVHRKVKSNTVSKTISAIQTLYLIEGVDLPILRDDRVKVILRGQANLDEEIGREGKTKQHPVTLNVMKLIRIQLRRAHLGEKRKALIWCICTVAFNGCKFHLLT